MALRWIEGFEIHGESVYLGRKYAAQVGAVSTSTPGRVGGRYGEFTSPPQSLTTPSFTSQNTWVIGFGLYVSTVHNGIQLRIMSGATEQLRLFVDTIDAGTTFNLKIQRGATLLATDPTSYARNTWHWFELKVTIHPSAGAYELRYDEVVKLSDTVENTANSGSAGANNFAFGIFTATGSIRLDDLYILDDTGSAPHNDFLGQCNIIGGLPDADGDRSEWTPSTGSPHFPLVDDPATAPNDADYVFSDTNGQVDLYEHNGFSSIASSVLAVMCWFGARMAAAGSRVVRVKVRDVLNAESEGDNKTVNSTSVREFGTVFEQNPVTAAPWTETDLDTTQFGPEVVS